MAYAVAGRAVAGLLSAVEEAAVEVSFAVARVAAEGWRVVGGTPVVERLEECSDTQLVQAVIRPTTLLSDPIDGRVKTKLTADDA